MLKTCTELQAAPLSLPEVSTPSGLLGRLRSRPAQEVVRSCLQVLATRELDQTGPQIGVWLSTTQSYTGLLLDPAFLTMEQAQQATKIMRGTDSALGLKMLNSLPEKASTDVMRRALRLLDATRDGEPVRSL